jgi:hypothetical protein
MQSKKRSKPEPKFIQLVKELPIQFKTSVELEIPQEKLTIQVKIDIQQ